MKNKKRSDKFLTIIGYSIAFLTVVFTTINMTSSIENLELETSKELLLVLLSVITFIVSYFFHIIVHEAGHLAAGLISGYKFVSFRIGKITFVKQDGKIAVKKTTIVGTGGQCLLKPPAVGSEKCPFGFYLLGGGLANFIVSGIFFLLHFCVFNNIYTLILSQTFGVLGLLLGFINLFPIKTSGIVNDGYFIFIDLGKNSDARIAQYLLLSINAELTEKKSVGEVSPELIEAVENYDYGDISNVSTANLYCYKSSFCLFNGDLKQYREINKRIMEESAIGIFIKESTCEYLYSEILGDKKPDIIDNLMNKELTAYIKQTSCYPSKNRLMYAYYLLYKKDKDAAESEYNKLIKTIETHPLRAESSMEFNEIARIQDLYQHAL